LALEIALESGEYPGLLQFLGEIVPRITEKSVRRVFRQFAPDLIISVHPLVQEIALRPLARLGRRIPFVTVVTTWPRSIRSGFIPR